MMEPGNPADEESAGEIETGSISSTRGLGEPNLELAKQIFDTRSYYRRVLRPLSREIAAEVGYWALKTTSRAQQGNHTGRCSWQKMWSP